MESRRKVWFIVSLVLLAMVIVPLGVSGCSAAPAKAKEVALMSNEAPSNFFTLTSNWIKILEATSDVKAVARVVPNVPSRFALMREGEAVAGVNVGMPAGPAIYGEDIYAKEGWGPQRLRAIFVSTMYDPLSMMTTKDSVIKGFADLKGKKVIWHNDDAGRRMITGGFLAFAGLTWDDVTKVPAPGYNEAIQMVMDGKADVTYGALGSAKFKEMEASPKGLRVLAVPQNNKAGWDAMYALHLGQVPGIVEKGPGDPSVYPLEVTGHNFFGTAGPALDEDVVYELAKAVHLHPAEFVEGLWQFKPADVSLDVLRDPKARDFCPMPLHPGYIKFLKEQKIWNDDWEAWQQQRLADEEQRIAKWKAGLK